MLSCKSVFLSVLFLVNSCICKNDFQLQKCDSQDATCLKELFQSIIERVIDGVPDLGTKPLDPLFIPHVSASTPNLHLEFKNSTITGLKNCKTQKIKYNTEKSTIYVKLVCNARMDGQYDMKGQLMILPIEGNGKARVVLRNAVIVMEADLPIEKQADGKRYFKVSQWSNKYELTEKCDINFDNLFNGNEILAKSVEELIANSSNEIILEVGGPIIKEIASNVIEEVKVMLKTIPVDDLFKN